MTGATIVKVAFIMGFYGNVENQLRGRYGAGFDRGWLVWIPMVAHNRPNMGIFKQALHVVLGDRTSDPVHVLLGTARGEEWIQDAVTGIIESMEGAKWDKRVSLSTFANLQDADPLIRKLEDCAFCTDDQPTITETVLANYLGDSSVLCVRALWQPSFRDAFERAGVPAGVFARHCTEDAVPQARNPNLIRHLNTASAQFHFLLYAWSGLRTLPPETKRRYRRGAFEGPTPAKVTALFKEGVLGSLRRAGGHA